MTQDPGEIVNLITRGIHDATIYFPEHPRVLHTATELATRIDVVLAAGDKKTLFLGVIDRRLVYDRKFLLGPTLIAKRLIDAADRLQCGGFLFTRGAAAAEFAAFFAVCGAARGEVQSLDEARALLRSRGALGVELSARFGNPGWAGGAGKNIDELIASEAARTLGSAITAYQQLRENVEGALGDAEAGRPLDVIGTRGTVESMLAEVSERPANIFHLARYPDYDSYTVGHSVRVALLALLVARRVTADERMLVAIGTAGLMHDVGKSVVPHEILFKRGKLTDDERRQMSVHPIVGAKLLFETREASQFDIAAAYGHHLRHDGRGYPQRKPWEVRSRVTSLVQVCDVFEALTAVRPHKPALTPGRAYQIMLEDRAAFDPTAFAAFVSAVGLYPPGSRVRLATGETAIVQKTNPDVARPVVELANAADGKLLEGGDRLLLDLSKPEEGPSRDVQEVILDDLAPTVPEPEETQGVLTADLIIPCCPSADTSNS